MAIATVNGQRLVAAPIRQDQVDDAISEIVETIGGPTDIEVTHPDGTLESHRLTAHTSSDTGSGGVRLVHTLPAVPASPRSTAASRHPAAREIGETHGCRRA